jgi:mono/diheme cytochrome c family protein
MTSKAGAVRAIVSSGAIAVLLAGALTLRAETPQEAGRALFLEKQCVRCHRARGEAGMGPPVEDLRRPQGQLELAGRMWNHVPGMLVSVGQVGVPWPRLTTAEMTVLMAYLDADSARDPKPDLSKGQVMVIRKGCLKCHSLRREGGRVVPDLAERRADYESPAAWAATMWTHTPRMAAMAAEHGIPFPRFTGDEMANLVAFLRATATATPGR